MNLTPKGIIVPVVTPFDSNQKIDEAALRKILKIGRAHV